MSKIVHVSIKESSIVDHWESSKTSGMEGTFEDDDSVDPRTWINEERVRWLYLSAMCIDRVLS